MAIVLFMYAFIAIHVETFACSADTHCYALIVKLERYQCLHQMAACDRAAAVASSPVLLYKDLSKPAKSRSSVQSNHLLSPSVNELLLLRRIFRRGGRSIGGGTGSGGHITWLVGYVFVMNRMFASVSFCHIL